MDIQRLRGVQTRMALPKIPARAQIVNAADVLAELGPAIVADADVEALRRIDVVYRTLCSILFNYVPLSGHPGGSISSGAFVQGLVFRTMDYDVGDPLSDAADQIVYAAGHKAMGLYAMWALRDELARIGDPSLLPEDRLRLRLEDLLGFRRNPVQETPLFREYRARPLDGHPTPLTPFVPVATGASGVGVPSALGIAVGAMDVYATDPPWVHIVEGEGGMTPGRVSEALATAASANLHNVVMHVDWNQASIDSDRVCADGGQPGDYVQWNPITFCAVHDWNVIFVPDGRDVRQILAAQALATSRLSDQPTAVVYRTVKGWGYGIEGRKSHGAGHKFCSPEFYASLGDFQKEFGVEFPNVCCVESDDKDECEGAFWNMLSVVRGTLEKDASLARYAAGALKASGERLRGRGRTLRPGAPAIEIFYNEKGPVRLKKPPAEANLPAGTSATLRGAVADVLRHLNKVTKGAFVAMSADLSGSTSISSVAADFPKGWYNAVGNRGSRLLATGGICEDAMGAIAGGLSAYGRHVGVTSSYGAFLAALEHVPARLHCIGQMARHELTGDALRTFVMVNAHAGVKTGEDGPTHADPQALQLLAENFPRGTLITLTPWEPNEAWPLLITALRKRPAVVAPFVTRPNETVPDREALGLAPASAAVDGVYLLVKPATKKPAATVVLQGSEVAIEFVTGVLPELRTRGIDVRAFYVASAELFDLLEEKRRRRIFPERFARDAIGITGFTLPTLYRFVASQAGREASLYPFKAGHFLGSGKAHKVLREAGLDAASQLQSLLAWIDSRKK